ncbi:MAG: translation initiation factor IF-5A [Candidatus Aenigmatarchaeota archaeon]
MMKTTAVIKDLKPNGFVLIDDVPCRIERVDVSKSGKHGAAKARVEGIGLFDGKRRSIVKPADDTVEVPILERKKAQVIAIIGEKAQLMDLTTFEVFELEIPEERREKIKQGEEVDYFEIVGIKTLKELK